MGPNTLGSATGLTTQQQPKQYKVGDTIKLVNYGFGVNELIGDEKDVILTNGQQIFEVEVKSVKTAKVILE